LWAAVVLSQLADKIISKIFLKIQHRYFRFDSSIVLAWITSSSSRAQIFVAHKVSNIHDLTMINEWNHVDIKDNPANINSRGCNSKKIDIFQKQHILIPENSHFSKLILLIL